MLFLAVVATVVAVLQHFAGGVELVFFAAPCLLMAGLLLAGRMPGERWILARRSAASPRRLRPARRRFPRGRERALASLIERSPSLLRGPPAPVAARC